MLMQLVLDTDVVVAAFRSPSGASAELLRMAALGTLQPIVTVALVLEYEAVLRRTEHLVAAGAEPSDADKFLDLLIATAKPVFVDYRWRPQTRDPADEMVLEAAINGHASAIVTFNRRDFGSAPTKFGIDCLLPGRILESLR